MDSGVVAGQSPATYADSVDSSPRSRGGDSWDDTFSGNIAGGAPRLRLMCSSGGRIVPRPTDKSLCYVNGDTRMVVVDKTFSLNDLNTKLARTFSSAQNFTLKYQLPNEELDSLISLTNDEDLENMIEEYERLAGGAAGVSTKSSRIRLFLFPAKTESSPAATIGSLLDESKSETWFVDALNNAMIDGLPRGMSADSASVNCLLGLEEDAGGGSVVAGRDVERRRDESSGKNLRQDLQSFDTTSSFGSASSAPSLSNVPPIRVRGDDQRGVGIEDRFGSVSVSSGAQYGTQNSIALSTATPSVSPTENSSRVFSSDDEKLTAGTTTKSTQIETQISDQASRTLYIAEQKREPPVALNSGYRGTNPVPDAPARGYVFPSVPQEQPPIAHLQHHQQPQHQQFIPTNSHFVHHPVTGAVVPISPYFHPVATTHPHQIQQSQQAHHGQLPLYYLPVRQQTPYNLSATPNLPDPNLIQPAGHRVQAQPIPAQAQPTVLQPQLMRGMGYHVMQEPQLSQPPATMPNYGYEYTTDPSHAQAYYSQATSPLALAAAAPQYQAVTSGAVTGDVVSPGDVKAARAL